MNPRPEFPLPGALTRRTFLQGSASLAAAWMLTTRSFGTTTAAPKVANYPFTLGVASGDPSPTGVVLWTRLAPQPRQPGGGMPASKVRVQWRVCADEGMTRTVARGVEIADPAWAHSVHVEVEGLRPDRWYWYDFKAGNDVSPRGRTRTLPGAKALPQRLRFAFASCQKHEEGYFTAFEHMTREPLDLIVHLGDYIYEKEDDRQAVRPHGTKQIFTLDEYRVRYGIYKTDPHLQAAHAAVPWIVTWDDHEVNNDYANAIPENPTEQTTGQFLQRRAAGYQAYYEHMPLRRSAMPAGPDMLLFRRLNFGRLAAFNVLDTRQYRTDQPEGRIRAWEPALLNPDATILGQRQREWLFDGLDRSSSRWNVLAQQVMVARPLVTRDNVLGYMMDKWPGYEFERRRLLRHFLERKTRNAVVITGDVHQHWANDLVADFDDLESRNVGVEFVGSSITSGGDGAEEIPDLDALVSRNPFVKFHHRRRGYVSCEVTPQQWRTDFRTIPYVSRTGAPLQTTASFVVEDGVPKLRRA